RLCKALPARRGLSVSRNSTRCTRGNSRARRLPNASVSPCVSPSTKFYVKSRTRHFVPRTQFAVKFPCRCRRRRHMSADGDGSRLFRQSEALPARRGLFIDDNKQEEPHV